MIKTVTIIRNLAVAATFVAIICYLLLGCFLQLYYGGFECRVIPMTAYPVLTFLMFLSFWLTPNKSNTARILARTLVSGNFVILCTFGLSDYYGVRNLAKRIQNSHEIYIPVSTYNFVAHGYSVWDKKIDNTEAIQQVAKTAHNFRPKIKILGSIHSSLFGHKHSCLGDIRFSLSVNPITTYEFAHGEDVFYLGFLWMQLDTESYCNFLDAINSQIEDGHSHPTELTLFTDAHSET